MQYDVILAHLGAKYSGYCAACARTYLVDPSKAQEAEYGALQAAHQAALQALSPGAALSSVHEAIVKAIQVRRTALWTGAAVPELCCAQPLATVHEAIVKAIQAQRTSL